MSAEPAAERRYTVVVTSCGRFDLLQETLRSLKPCLDMAPDAWIVVEDSGDEGVRAAVAACGIEAEIILNRPQLGQMKAIDRAYERVNTPYVFHCEDDWDFYRRGFIAESFAVLEACPDVSIVLLRPREEQNKLVRNAPTETVNGVQLFFQDPALHPEYFSYAFNPGMRRISDYRLVGPFGPIGYEPDISYAFKKRGFRLANLEEGAVRHIGDGRHVEDPTLPKKARDPWAKLKRSLSKRVKRVRRALNGD